MEYKNFQKLVNELQYTELLEGMDDFQATIIARSIDIQQTDQQQATEDLVLDLSPEGKSTSVKLSNIKFRMADFLIEVTGIGVQVSTPKPNPVGLLLSGLRFILKMKELTTIGLSRREAEILFLLCHLKCERENATIDLLFEEMPLDLSRDQIRESLDKLEKLSCIEYSIDEIKLVEEIVMVKQR